MGMKNSSKLDFLKKEGFYVILFLCLCILAVVAVYVSKTNSQRSNEISQAQETKIEESMKDAHQVQKTPEDPNLPTVSKNAEEENKEKKEETSKKEEDKKTEDKKETKNTSTKESTISLTAPVKGEVSKKFFKDDLQHTKSLDIWETHEAIDFACSLGDEVKAAAKGKVVDVYNDDKAERTLKSGYGLTVVIEHDGGFRTVYSNLADNLKIKKGDSVEAGSVIGVIGDTSVRESVKVEGVHLHFSLLQKSGKDYQSIDPEKYIKK